MCTLSHCIKKMRYTEHTKKNHQKVTAAIHIFVQKDTVAPRQNLL
jgi:hypothetical protein